MNARVPAHELRLYRSLTFNLLRRYFRLALSLGRLPSLVGREFFRTQYQLQHHTFEDSVIFVHDMERCIARLDSASQQVLTKLIFEDYTQEETARLLHCTVRTIERRFPLALDLMADLMLQGGLMRPFECHRESAAASSPAGADENSPARECREGEAEGGDTAPEGRLNETPPETCQDPKNPENSRSYSQ